jgi:serine/threonine protein kinase
MKELALNNCRLDGRYDIHEQLGRGSYAEIYLARDILASTNSPHCHVVIKALNVFLQDDLDDALERTLVENFQNEAIALDRVRHPNIISRLGHGTASDLNGAVFHYLVLEYLPGGDLNSLVRREDLPVRQVLNYVEQVCAGLAHAHEHSIIHRDIKPQNLLLTEDHITVKIADFGVARVSTADSPITRVGTNVYAPPEHSPMFAGQTGVLTFSQLTPAADIYSLAKTIYTLVCGESPRAFANEMLTELPESVRSELWAEELLAVLRKATHGDPRARHQSVDEFWNDLTIVRGIVETGHEGMVLRKSSEPQAHVSRGYTPFAPEQPQFDAELPAAISKPPVLTSGFKNDHGHSPYEVNAAHSAERLVNPPVTTGSFDTRTPPATLGPPKKRRIRKLAVFAIFLLTFTGILYGTASYMRGRGILPEIRNPFKTQTAVASTDIYLRPDPSTDNEPVGYVTKNSKLRIVKSQNNWYQVDVIEQGRPRASQLNANRGWLNSKYLDLDN